MTNRPWGRSCLRFAGCVRPRLCERASSAGARNGALLSSLFRDPTHQLSGSTCLTRACPARTHTPNQQPAVCVCLFPPVFVLRVVDVCSGWLSVVGSTCSTHHHPSVALQTGEFEGENLFGNSRIEPSQPPGGVSPSFQTYASACLPVGCWCWW